MNGMMKQFSQSTQSVEFDLKNTEVDPAAWMKAHGFDDVSFIRAPGMIVATVRGRDAFIAGSARTIHIETGISAIVGLPDLSKSFEDEKLGVPSFDQLTELTDLEIFEVTLTGNPAVGRLADFQVVKSLDPGGDRDLLEDKSVPFCKTNDEHRQVFGYVLVPDLPDFQGDVVSSKSVEQAAHSFLKVMSGRRQQGSGTGLEHDSFDGHGHPIESFIDHDGKFGVKGGWVLGTQIVDPIIWDKIKSGEIRGYSIGGRGTRRPIEGAQLKAATQEKKSMPAADTELYAVAFRKSAFNADEARMRAVEMGNEVDKMTENENFTLFEQKPADLFKGDMVECEVFAGMLTVRGELKDVEEVGSKSF